MEFILKYLLFFLTINTMISLDNADVCKLSC